MGFEFQTEGERTQGKQDFRQLEHTGAMSEVKTSNDGKHLKEEGQERQEETRMCVGSLGGWPCSRGQEHTEGWPIPIQGWEGDKTSACVELWVSSFSRWLI